MIQLGCPSGLDQNTFPSPVGRALHPGKRRSREGGHPLVCHGTHVRVEPVAKPLVDGLLLGRGFIPSRAAPSLPSIDSQPPQGFEKNKTKKKIK
jgi:hypothetical protein